MDGWKARQLQLVWFLIDPAMVQVAGVFRSATKSDASFTQSAQYPVVGTVATASGPFKDMELTVQAQRGRVDMLLAAPQRDDATFPEIVDVPSAIDELTRAATIDLGLGAASRLSFTGNFIGPESDLREATLVAARLAGVEVPYPDATDFQYILNRRMQRGRFEINRVLRWFVELRQLVRVGGPSVQADLAASRITPAFAVDVNTVQQPNISFDSRDQPPIFEMMGGEVKRIFHDGSIGALA
jgi:hypothetical protein